MLGGYLSWLGLLFEPLAEWDIPPIQPQARLRPENRPWNTIITGAYGVPAVLKLHDRKGNVSWSWQREDVTQPLPPALERCLWSDANDATDLKWMRSGKSVGAVYSNLVMVVNHTPEDPENDKKITWAICRDNEFFWNAHALEALPGNRVAVGTTGERPWDGIIVYDMSMDKELVDDPPILQNITGLRAIHGLIWDEEEQLLWAAGTDAAADGSDPVPAYGALVAYPFNSETNELSQEDAKWYLMPHAYDQETEWGSGYPWWVGPHDLVPVPNERKFLVSTDRDIYEFDINDGAFINEGTNVTDKYMPGFEVTTDDRHGFDRAGNYLELPRSDLKGFSLAPDGSYVYVQSLWRFLRGFHTSIVENGVRRKIMVGDEIYRSRWFGELDGWPKPR
ncbi:hypothetical protein N7468_004419 [Penicillium chermesinum]|uniref:Uncharacterized protein n=1 Tax=Penicillium chermesinum TaxID=63820 RepID=A0A9W9TSJ2_9EURO|nr:uncharacterized protein N7468_004419 [Penicillium chermesinum]KAJ5239800.1 hypothetical protein N7468_004419 [Penicillium chermesinum]KAJ6166677.1 hypothetical protein N7470_002124 [Penicillium chermesinum]